MEEFVYYGMLFDIYKGLLNEVNVQYYSLYYEENLTLQEIADNKGVSKSYVGSIIKKTTKKLEELENTLKLYSNKQKLSEILKLDDINKIKAEIEKMI